MTHRGKRSARKRQDGGGSYDVGYGKPPKHSQFTKGQSGNPKGRPAGKKNMRTMVESMLYAPIQIQQNGRTMQVSTLEAVLLKIRNNALAGDFRSAKQLIELAAKVPDPSANDQAQAEIPELDSGLLVTLLRDYLDHNDSSPDASADSIGEDDE